MLKENTDYMFDPQSSKLCLRKEDKWIPIVCDGYRFDQVIAPGANGIAMKAYHDVTDREVAIKIWKPRSKDMVRYKEQFLSELRKISNISHKNVVTIFDGKTLDSGYCIGIMDYVKGVSLRKWLHDKHTAQEKLDLCREILETVCYYQQAEILHGDLHTGNILVSKDNSIKIIDFGTSEFSPEGKAQEREASFVADLVNTLIKGITGYSVDHFGFKIVISRHKNCLEKKNNFPFEFQFTPMLVTITLLEYLEIIEILYNTPTCRYEELVDISGHLSKSRYLSIIEFANSMLTNHVNESEHQVFINALVANIEVDTFPEYQEFSLDEEAFLFQASIYAYYELCRRILPPLINPIGNRIKIAGASKEGNNSKDIHINNNLVLILESSIKLKDSNSYLDVCFDIALKCNMPLYTIQDAIRMILFYSLETYFNGGEVHTEFIYWVNTRIDEIRLDPTLKKAIEQLIKYNDTELYSN